MAKRKIFSDDDDDNSKNDKNKKRPKIIFESCPPVSSIKDLINIGKTNKFYKNINILILWDILPYLEELDNMIGMEGVKETIFYQLVYYLQNMHLQNNQEYLHMCIMGKPGSGKTTLAKIIANIYKHMGILSKKGSFTIAGRDDLVGQYLGETAIKTKKLLTSCLGGVLFIDEVYSLGSGKKDKDSYSKECVDTLCGFLSEHKNDFCCIIAGYEEEVKKCFFSINSGLDRRFPWIHRIGEYSSSDLTKILIKMINGINWKIHPELNIDYLSNFFEINKEYFKNFGGSVETFISKAKMVHSKRVFHLNKEYKFILNKEDFNNSLEILKKNKLDEKKVNYDYYT